MTDPVIIKEGKEYRMQKKLLVCLLALQWLERKSESDRKINGKREMEFYGNDDR